MTSLPPRVFLAFDDFSLAGKHVFPFAKVDGEQIAAIPHSKVDAFFSAELAEYVTISQHSDGKVAFVTVHSASLKSTQRWELADALVTALDQVQELVIVAALHLPYAKDGGLNVFHWALNAGVDLVDSAVKSTLPAADPKWDVTDPWLAALLHLLKVERAPSTHLLLAKGYKPGRDLSGTYDAVEALAKALQVFSKEKVTVDFDEMQRQLPRILAKEKVRNAEQDDHLTLLYH